MAVDIKILSINPHFWHGPSNSQSGIGIVELASIL